ncbi:hypothetical protein IW262DRAFT_1412747 [Armillaria fumosa]|nr:hypothetical protein IW262DRAFT_1412747 [Armillaria fumosa]
MVCRPPVTGLLVALIYGPLAAGSCMDARFSLVGEVPYGGFTVVGYLRTDPSVQGRSGYRAKSVGGRGYVGLTTSIAVESSSQR